jgi:hypothetical protein
MLAATMPQAALEDASQAPPSRKIQEHGRVGRREPDRQRRGIVAVSDPRPPSNEIALPHGELLRGARLPRLVVVERIQVTTGTRSASPS